MKITKDFLPRMSRISRTDGTETVRFYADFIPIFPVVIRVDFASEFLSSRLLWKLSALTPDKKFARRSDFASTLNLSPSPIAIRPGKLTLCATHLDMPDHIRIQTLRTIKSALAIGICE